ncbi:MAG TPA: flavin reductase family protein [Clostridia bacterium]|nr:flavin reductase family protein [Clostridia bacterium]
MAVEKVRLRSATMLFPVPVVVVTVGNMEHANLVTVAWTGVVCSNPPMVGIALRPQRHSHKILKEQGDFVVNIPSAEQVKLVDYCGMHSGRRKDKFTATGLTKVPATKVSPPLVEEFPLHLECRVEKSLPLGSHELFIGRVLAVVANREVLDETGHIDPSRVAPLAYALERYYSLGPQVGTFGCSRSDN